MKTPTDDLFRLIKSMSLGEKRHFRSQEGQTLTMHFFELMNERDSYSEEEIRYAVKDESFRKHIKVHKNRLQQMIMSSLRCGREQLSEAQRIRETIDFIEILISKQLYDMAWSALQKAKKAADVCEEYELKLSLLAIQNRYEAHFRAFDDNQDRAHVVKEMHDCIKIIENFTVLAQVCTDLIANFHLKDQTETINQRQKRIGDLLETQLFSKTELKPISPTADRMYNFAMAIWRRSLSDLEGYYHYTKLIMQSFETNPKVQDGKLIPYISSIHNCIVACQHAKKTKELWSLVEKMETLASSDPSLENFLIFAYQQRIVAYKQEQRWEDAIYFYENKILPLAERPDLFVNEQFHYAVARMAEVYLLVGNKTAAGKLFAMLEKAFEFGSEWYDLSAVLEIIYRIETNDFAHLEILVSALQKRLARHQTTDKPFLNNMLAFAKKVATTGNFEHKELFAKQLEKLEDFKNDAFYAFMNNCFMFETWLNCKVQGINWKATMAEKEYAPVSF
jgi:hypothetical protein